MVRDLRTGTQTLAPTYRAVYRGKGISSCSSVTVVTWLTVTQLIHNLCGPFTAQYAPVHAYLTGPGILANFDVECTNLVTPPRCRYERTGTPEDERGERPCALPPWRTASTDSRGTPGSPTTTCPTASACRPARPRRCFAADAARAASPFAVPTPASSTSACAGTRFRVSAKWRFRDDRRRDRGYHR